MSRPVFISYARPASATGAQALATRLGELAFLDTGAIDDGDEFPQRLLDGLLDASVVVIFATSAYLDRRFCRLEMRLTLAGGDAAASHVILALGEGGDAVLDAMPMPVASQSWPDAQSTERLHALIERRLRDPVAPIRRRLNAMEARTLSTAFLEESAVPPPQSLVGIISSLPVGLARQSIGVRFVGRADALRAIHRVLSAATGAAAQLTSRLVAAGGFGKTRLAIEYLHRYARYYPGGLFWIDAASSTLEGEFWRVLRALDSTVPELAEMRRAGRSVRRELETALRGIRRPALYVIDNIREAEPGSDPATIADFCPSVDAVTILATSRQDTREESVKSILVDALGRDAAILLLTDNVQGTSALAWHEWAQIADCVGNLPIALDLLNRSLALGSISPRVLLERFSSTHPSASAAGELDRLREALHGQVPRHAARGVTETFLLSFERLDPATQLAAKVLAQLAPTPIPDAFIDALADEPERLAVRAALRARHFLTFGDERTVGVMHRLMGDFLRGVAGTSTPALLERACGIVQQVMTYERCQDPRHWPLMRLCRPHAETLFTRGVSIEATAVVAAEMGLITGTLANAQGDHADARRLLERVLEVRTRVLGQEHPGTLMSMNSLATTLMHQGHHAEARRLLEHVLEVRTRVLGEEHPDTLVSMNNLASTLWHQGYPAGVRPLLERLLRVGIRVLGEEHPNTLRAMTNLTTALSHQGDHAGARRRLEQVLEVQTRVLGEEHPDTLRSLNRLALTLGALGDHAGARRLHERVLELQTRVLGEKHPDTLRVLNDLATTLWHHGDRLAARRLQERVLELRTRVLGEEHPDTVTSLNNLATTIWYQGDHAAARRLLEHVIEVQTRVLGEEHPDALTALNNLAIVLWRQRDHAAARRLLEHVIEVQTRVLGEEHPDTQRSLNNLRRAQGVFAELSGRLLRHIKQWQRRLRDWM